MNTDKRQPYVELGQVEFHDGCHMTLCGFCRFAEWSGDCGEAECDCKYPLIDRSFAFEQMYDALQNWEGYDCWGFRPLVSPDVAADIVGIGLQDKTVDWDTVPLLVKRKIEVETMSKLTISN